MTIKHALYAVTAALIAISGMTYWLNSKDPRNPTNDIIVGNYQGFRVVSDPGENWLRRISLQDTISSNYIDAIVSAGGNLKSMEIGSNYGKTIESSDRIFKYANLDSILVAEWVAKGMK